jgi:hypothetical protein
LNSLELSLLGSLRLFGAFVDLRIWTAFELFEIVE